MGVIVRQKVEGKGNPWWVFISHNGKRTSRMVGSKSVANAVADKIREKLQLDGFGLEKEERATEPTFKEHPLDNISPDTCFICHHSMTMKSGKPNTAVRDHCHTTGQIRGLICSSCNLMLGRIHDDEAILLRAAAYLRRSGKKDE